MKFFNRTDSCVKFAVFGELIKIISRSKFNFGVFTDGLFIIILPKFQRVAKVAQEFFPNVDNRMAEKLIR